jgi:hypothetical protein
MAASSLMAARRFSPQTRRRLQVVFAKAWEALSEAYRAQAVDFVRRVSSRLPADEALDRYFREVGVPATMEPAVRARALIALASLVCEGTEPESDPRFTTWSPLRPDQMFDALRRRAHSVEETNLACRLAACVSDEALAATHVAMALETAEVAAAEVTPDEGIMHYVRSFSLPAIDAQIIFQRAMALWAERHPADETVAPRPVAAMPAAERDGGAAFGLRVV